MSWEPVSKLANMVKNGEVSAVSLVTKSLDEIKKKKKLNALITVCEKEAINKARKIDELVKQGKADGLLLGVPYVAKDNFLTEGIETTAGSNILKGFVPPYSSTATSKLDSQGAILVGKANLDAFAHGSSTENSDFGPTLNAHDPERVAGGSSGGSAVAVAAGMVPFSLGTDTGGSIRLPASFNGVVGVKPTYGLISRYGVVAMASSTDVVGPITTNVNDAALLIEVLAGKDKHDSTTIGREQKYTAFPKKQPKDFRVGVIKQHLGSGVDNAVKDATLKTIAKIRASGAKVVEIDMPIIDLALACYYIIVPAEVSSNLMRYDGVRYGYSAKDAQNLEQLYKLTRSRGFNSENKRRIMIGTYVLSSGYYDAYYKKAQTVRTKIFNEFKAVFNSVDVLIGPTSPTVAFKLGENTSNPLKMYLADIMTVATNLAGICAISIPNGFDGKLPIGLQIMADQKQDKTMLNFARLVEELNK